MPTIIDAFADEQLDRFGKFIGEHAVERLDEFRELLDGQLIEVKNFQGLTKRRIRAMCWHDDCLVLASHCGQVKKLNLDSGFQDSDETKPPVAWTYPKQGTLPSRCLGCAIGRRNGKVVVLVSLEAGGVHILDFKTGKCLEEIAIDANLSSIASYPDPNSEYADKFAVCSTGKRKLYVFRTYSEATRKAELISTIQFEESPRSCFWAEGPNDRPALFVFTADGVTRVFECADAQFKELEDYFAKKNVVRAGAEVFHAVLLAEPSEINGDELQFLVTSQPPVVATMHSWSGKGATQEYWPHLDDDRCYVAASIRHLDRVVLGSRNGDLWIYSHDGSALAWWQVSMPARAACAIQTNAGKLGIAVAHGMGELTIFWCPKVEGEGGLLDQVMKEFTDIELRAKMESTPILALLRADVLSEKYLSTRPVTARIPAKLDRAVPENFLPGFFSVVSSWVSTHSREVVQLWPLIQSWLRVQTIPAALQRLAQTEGDAIGSLLPAGFGAAFRKLLNGLLPPDELPDERLRVTRAQAAQRAGDWDLVEQLLSPVRNYFKQELAAQEYWEYLGRVDLPSAVEGIVSSPEVIGRVAVLVADGAVYDLVLRPTLGIVDRLEAEPLTLTLIPNDGRVAGPSAVGLTAESTVVVSGRGFCTTTHHLTDSSTTTEKIIDTGITGMAVYGSQRIFGTVDGRVFYQSTPQSPATLIYESTLKTRIRGMALGRFRRRDTLEFAAFQQRGNLIVGRVDGTHVEEFVAGVFCPDHVVSADCTGDGLGELVFVDRPEHTVWIHGWQDAQPSHTPTQRVVDQAISAALVFRAEEQQSAAIAVGTSSGEVRFSKSPWKVWTRLSLGYPASNPGNDAGLGRVRQPRSPARRVTALGGIRRESDTVLVTASGVHVDLWQSVPRAEIDMISNVLNVSEPPLRLPESQEEVATPSIKAAVQELQKHFGTANNRVAVLSSLPGAGKLVVLKNIRSNHSHNLFVARVLLEPSDLHRRLVGRQIIRAVRQVYSYGVQAPTWDLAELGNESHIQSVLSQIRSWLLRAPIGPQRGRLIVAFDRKQPHGPLLDDLIETGVGTEFTRILEQWAAEFGPEIQFVVLSDRLEQGIARWHDSGGASLPQFILPGRLTDADAQTVLESYFPQPGVLATRARQHLLAQADWSLMVLGELCRRTAMKVRHVSIRTITEEMVREVSGEMALYREEPFKRLWQQLSEGQRVAVAVAAHLDRHFEEFNQVDFASFSVLADWIRDRAQLSDDWERLTKWQVLDKSALRQRYRFVSRRFAAWVRTQEKSLLGLLLRQKSGHRDQDQFRSVPIRLDELRRFDEELKLQGQLEEALQLLTLEATRWKQLVQLSALYEIAAKSTPGSGGVSEFLTQFLRSTSCQHDELHSSPDSDLSWTVGNLPVAMAVAEYPVVFLACSGRLLSKAQLGRAREEFETALREIIADGKVRAGSSPEPNFLMLLVCGSLSKDAQRFLNEFPRQMEWLILDQEKLREVVFSNKPDSAIRRSMRGLDVTRAVPNPFFFEGRVRQRPMAVPRRSLGGRLDLAAVIASDFQSYKIVGSRRIGKTTLLFQIQWQLETDWQHPTCLCSFETVLHATADQAEQQTWILLEIAVVEMATKIRVRANDFPQPDGLRSPEDLARWHVALRASPYRVTLLLDEFDAIIKHSETKAFLAQLRSEILAPDSRIRVVLAGWSNLERAVRTGDSPAANFGENERLLPLDLEKARTLIVDVMEANGLEYADRESALKEVAGQASLHPSFLQLFLRLLFDRAFRENVLVTSDLIREIGRTDDFRKEVVRTVRENFEGWTLLAFAALLKESHSQTRETSIPTLRRRMAQYLEQQSCPVRQVSQTEFDLAKELLLKATAAEVISRPLMENRMSYTFPKALTEEDAETLAVTACQHFNT